MLQIIAGHVDSSVHFLWEELNFLDCCINILIKGKLECLEITKLSCQYTDCSYLCDTICSILNNENYSGRPKLVEQKNELNIKKLREVNLLDDIWSVLKSK